MDARSPESCSSRHPVILFRHAAAGCGQGLRRTRRNEGHAKTPRLRGPTRREGASRGWMHVPRRVHNALSSPPRLRGTFVASRSAEGGNRLSARGRCGRIDGRPGRTPLPRVVEWGSGESSGRLCEGARARVITQRPTPPDARRRVGQRKTRNVGWTPPSARSAPEPSKTASFRCVAPEAEEPHAPGACFTHSPASSSK